MTGIKRQVTRSTVKITIQGVLIKHRLLGHPVLLFSTVAFNSETGLNAFNQNPYGHQFIKQVSKWFLVTGIKASPSSDA